MQNIARYILAHLYAAKMQNIPFNIHKYSRLACKNVTLPKSIFCSGEWACYAKHLLQWRRVLLFVVLVWQDKCIARWWCALPYERDISLSRCSLNFYYVCCVSDWAVLRFEYPASFRRRVRMKNSMLQCAIVWVSCWHKAAIARKE